jgi:hypothetical protein
MSGLAPATARNGQEYVNPLLVLSGNEYAASGFAELYERLCDALRGSRPRATLQMLLPDGSLRVVYEDGSERVERPLRERFFELADRLAHATDVQEQSCLKPSLRLTSPCPSGRHPSE